MGYNKIVSWPRCTFTGIAISMEAQAATFMRALSFRFCQTWLQAERSHGGFVQRLPDQYFVFRPDWLAK